MSIRHAWGRANERRRYWQTVPLPGLASLTLASFCTFVCLGLASDLTSGLRLPWWWILTWAGCFGLCTAASFTAALHNPKSRYFTAPILFLLMITLLKFLHGFPLNQTLAAPGFESIRRRLAVDGQVLTFAPTLAWITFIVFAGTQGLRHVRERTELELAEKLQQALAPPLSTNNASYEIHGISSPSSQMGGDLLDVVSHDGALACYIGDVAGHGIQAGVFMGMVKSSARMALLRPAPLGRLLSDLNQVLYGVKAGSATYVTFACVRCAEGGRVEYSLAGHGPILHYHARSKAISQIGMEQFPLGLFASANFESGNAEMEPGDILALLTDGLPEVTDAKDEQYGLERIGKFVAENARGGLTDLTEKLFAEVRRHGQQNDDETLVLVRASA